MPNKNTTPPKRDDIIQRVREKNPTLDEKLIEHFVTLLENAIHATHEHQAAYYMNKAIFYAKQMQVIENDDDIADFYFDDTETVSVD